MEGNRRMGMVVFPLIPPPPPPQVIILGFSVFTFG